jgi:hypothetical protein
MTNSYYDDGESCLHCGYGELKCDWDTTLYVCLKCNKPQLEVQEIERPQKNKVRKFKDNKSI